MIYLVDIEASSLADNGFPVEIAWMDAEGRGETHLIRPHAKWLEGGCPGWSAGSEAVHGISLRTLLEDGSPVEQVAARAAAVLATSLVMVFSDAPGHDAVWLADLLHVGGQRAGVRLFDVQQLYGWTCRPLLDGFAGLDGEDRRRAEGRASHQAQRIVAQAHEEEGHRSRVRHRALPDVEATWRTWHRVAEMVALLS